MIYETWEKVWKNKKIRTTFLAALIMMLAAHAYTYFNSTFFHDRSVVFWPYAFNSATRTKWMAQFVDLLTSFAYLPWLFGILCIIYIAISVYIIVDVLDINKSLSIFIVAGLCATNSSVIAAHFYWPFEIMAALPFACLSVYFWNKQKMKVWLRLLFEIGFVALSLGTYGAYSSVGPALVIVACIQLLFRGEKAVNVFKRGIEYVISFVCGGAAYYLILRFFLAVQHLSINTYLTESKLDSGVTLSELWDYTVKAYSNSLNQYIGKYHSMMPKVIAIAFLAIGTILFIYYTYEKREKIQKPSSITLLVILIFLFPLAAGLITVLSFDCVHFLMVFTYVVFYIGLIVLAEKSLMLSENMNAKSICRKILATGLLLLSIAFICRGVLVANMAYMRLESNYRASESIGTRMLTEIESTEGFTGNETVVFVGDFYDSEYITRNNYKDADYLNFINELEYANKKTGVSFTYPGMMFNFMKDIIGCTLPMRTYDQNLFSTEQNKEIISMPVYPENGAINKFGDILVVKLTEMY